MGNKRNAALLISILACACGGPDPGTAQSTNGPIIPRHTTVWLGDGGLDEMTAAELRMVGVDKVLVRRGVLDLAGAAPVLGFQPMPPMEGDLPSGIVLRVEGAREGLDADMAHAVWRAIAAQEGDSSPVEVVLDLPEVPPGMAEFLAELSRVSGIPIVPLLSVGQLGGEEVGRLVTTAGVCIVPVAGTGHSGLRGVGEGGAVPLYKNLEPLARLGVAVRPAIGLEPVTLPEIEVWGDDLNLLTEPVNGEVRTSSELDRTFVLGRALDWSGRSWDASSRLAVAWWDTAKLGAKLTEIDRLALPDVVGWDLVPLPPPGDRLGLGLEVLLRYLGGEGPAPDVRLEAKRSGRTVRVSLINNSPFVSAVSGVGNWLEVSVSQGSILVNGLGSFDRLELGTRRGGSWQAKEGSVADAVRFSETYLAPHEELETGSMRFSVSRAQVRIRWHILLSSGEEVTGELTR